MNVINNKSLLGLIGGVLLLLGIAEVILRILKRRPESGIDTAILETFRLRVAPVGDPVLRVGGRLLAWSNGHDHPLLSDLILGVCEFITLTPTRPGDHRTLFWVFFLFPPLHYFFIWRKWYGTFFILIPVYGFLFVPASIALAGDYKRFLERTAKIQAGLLICVYCLSCAPALLTLNLPPLSENTPDTGGKVTLLFFFLLIVQLSDALQYAWSQIPSRHVIAPTINPTKTWEGLLGGTASVALIGAVLYWATPFRRRTGGCRP